jgi:hypothetical protein
VDSEGYFGPIASHIAGMAAFQVWNIGFVGGMLMISTPEQVRLASYIQTTEK